MTERVTVNGIEFPIVSDRLGSWRTFGLLRDARMADDDYAKADSLMGIACYITGLDEGAFVEKCGGVDAPVSDVLTCAAEVIKEAYPKN